MTFRCYQFKPHFGLEEAKGDSEIISRYGFRGINGIRVYIDKHGPHIHMNGEHFDVYDGDWLVHDEETGKWFGKRRREFEDEFHSVRMS